jgi:hypothetical protein
MGDTVFYMRSSSLHGMAASTGLPDGVIDDLREFVEIEDDYIQKTLQLLNDSSAFLKRSDFLTLLRSEIGADQATLLARLIHWIHRYQFEESDLSAFFRQLRAVEGADDNSEPAFTESDLNLIRARFDKISNCWNALDRQAKAENLGKATGQRLQSVQLVCDLRPIFDNERKTIDGFLPITTMHIVFEGADGLPDSFDVILSEKDVERLSEHTRFAKNKLAAMKCVAEQLNTPIPSTDLTASI